MSISSISSLSSLTSSASSSSAASSLQSTFDLDFSTYLKILTTQLQNQDPTNATDPNQFTQELMQMAQVQSQINNNEYLEKLTKATSANSLATGVGYIDKYVRSSTKDGDFSLQKGTSEIGYTLPSEASTVTITVKDSDGKKVASLYGCSTIGDNYVTWDGSTNDGTKAADGAYTFSIEAKDSNGNAIEITNPTALFLVTGIQNNGDGNLKLEAGNLSLLSSDVTGVYTPSTLPAATAATLKATS